jgi:hypothetical protein
MMIINSDDFKVNSILSPCRYDFGLSVRLSHPHARRSDSVHMVHYYFHYLIELTLMTIISIYNQLKDTAERLRLGTRILTVQSWSCC